MKRVWFLFLVCGVLAQAIASAQESSTGSSNALWYEHGQIANNSYINECFGLSIPIPDGWQSNGVGPDAMARHLPNGVLSLLTLRGPIGNTISLSARDPKGSVTSIEEYVSGLVHAEVDGDPEHRELLYEVVPVDYGGRHFSRADYKQSSNGAQTYEAFVFTKFRGYYIGATFIARSVAGLEESAKPLQNISFREDTANPKCVMKGEPLVIKMERSPGPATAGIPGRVRVSQGVARNLLIKKVDPLYPEDARHDHIQGQVVLQVIIDKNGDIESVMLVSGHPALAPAAIEAVKQWKYKPYLLNSQPVQVETQVVVNFTLSGG
jgi:TonB family protein